MAENKLRTAKYDILHFHTQVQAFDSACLMKQIPTVISIDMTAYQVAMESAPPYRWTYNPNIAMEKRAFESAAHIVTWSNWARKSVIADHAIDERKVTTVAPGARLWTFGPPSFEPTLRPRILFVGGDFKRKGGWDLLETFRDHFTDEADLHLVTDVHIERLPQNAHLHSGIGAYSPEWHELFRMADILVLPSYAEAFGLVIQEAAGYGLAIIGSDVGAIPELISDGDNGFLMRPGSKSDLKDFLEILIRDDRRLLQMKRRSREMAVLRFDAVKNTEPLVTLFRRLAISSKT